MIGLKALNPVKLNICFLGHNMQNDILFMNDDYFHKKNLPVFNVGIVIPFIEDIISSVKAT